MKKTEPSQDALELVLDRVNLYEGYIQDTEKKRKEWWRLYRGELEKPDAAYKEDSAIPYTTATINTIVPRMTQNDTKFRYKGETEKDNLNAPKMSELANDQMRKDELELTKVDVVTEAMVLGTAVAKVPWTKKTQIADYDKPLFTKIGEKIGILRETKEKTLLDQPTVDHILLSDFYFDPYGWTINGKNECEWVAHRKLISEKKLIAQFGEGILEKLAKSKANLDERASDIQQEVKLPADKHKNNHELIEYWENDRKVIMLDRCYIAEDIPNPFRDKKKPFILEVDRRVPHQLLGVGEIEFLQGMQTILNNFVRASVDKQTQAEHNLLFLEKQSGLDKEQFNKQPFGIHTVEDLTKIKFEKLDPVDNMTVQLIEMIKTFHDAVSGTSDFSKGNADGSLNDTATGIQLIQDAANKIFEAKSKLLNKMFMKQLGDFIVSRNQQFLSNSDTVTVMVKNEAGIDEYHNITKKDIEGNFITIPEESAPVNDSIRRSEALMVYRQFKDDPDVDQIELKKEVLEAFGKDVTKVMKTHDQTDLAAQQEVTDAEMEAESEDGLMFAGKTVSVAQTDDHEVHIVVHNEALTQAPNEVFPVMNNHIQAHKAFLSPRLAPLMKSVLQNGMFEQPDLESMVGGMNEEEQGTGEIPGSTGGAENQGTAPEEVGQGEGDGGLL